MLQNLEVIACPCCDRTDHTIWAEESGYKAVKCAGCGLVYVTPRPSLKSIAAANRIGEHRAENGPVVVRSRRKLSKVLGYRKRLGRLFPDLIASGRPVRWLDVGAGYGELLEAVLDTMPPGSSATGIEPMEVKSSAARAAGFDVQET